MVNIDEAFEVRLNKNGNHYEVLVDFDKYRDFKDKPEEIDVYEVLADHKIFKDQKKGEIAPESNLDKDFESKEEIDIIKEILLEGEAQIPTSYINKMREETKKRIISYIAENAINPVTNTKFSASMVESEFNSIKFNVNYEKDHVNQAEEVIKLLKKSIPIKIEKSVIELSIPPSYVGAFYGPFRKYGSITKEYYDDEGNLRIHIEVTSGIIDDVINYIKNKANNEASYHISKV